MKKHSESSIYFPKCENILKENFMSRTKDSNTDSGASTLANSIVTFGRNSNICLSTEHRDNEIGSICFDSFYKALSDLQEQCKNGGQDSIIENLAAFDEKQEQKSIQGQKKIQKANIEQRNTESSQNYGMGSGESRKIRKIINLSGFSVNSLGIFQ